MTATTDQIKAKKEHIDTISVTDHPFKPQHEELDRFGASLVRSPAEAALVKKLDRWMMVSLSIETNYLRLIQTAYSLVDVLSVFPRP